MGRTLDVPDTGIIYDLLWADLAKRLLITVFSAPDHYGEFDNAGVTMTTDGDIDGLHSEPSPDRGRTQGMLCRPEINPDDRIFSLTAPSQRSTTPKVSVPDTQLASSMAYVA